MNLISVAGLNLNFGDKVVFANADFEVLKGGVVGVLGSNGSGKTTFFDLLCALKQPDSARIINRSNNHLYLSQTLSAPPALRMSDLHTLIVNLNSVRTPTESETVDKLTTWSTTLGARYSEILKKKPAICSYGEIRSFFTLTLLTLKADLFLLDEPTAGVDPEFRYYIWSGIKAAQKSGATFIVSSHHINEIVNNCDKFYMLAKNKFVQFSGEREYLEHYGASTLDEAFINASIRT